MHLMVCTRPDIAYAVGRLSRHCQWPTEQHWKAVQRVFRYLAGTSDMQIRYGGPGKDLPLVGYSDSSFSDDLVDRRSTMAYAIRIAGGAIAWMSKKAPTVALSTTEAEYMALSQSAKQLIWTARTMEELGLE